MAEKLQDIIELSEALTVGLSKDVGRWRNYLEAAARLYKYPFAEQLLIYGQRPDATACASTKIWNTRMGRWVNQYARGIALLDDSGQKTRLKYVFDISDTHPGRYRPKRPYIWQLKDFQQELIAETLLQSFGEAGMEFEAVTQTMQRICGEVNRVEQFAQEPVIEKLLAIAALVTEDNHLDYADELYQIKAESSLELLDEKTRKERFVRLLFYSVSYMVLSRCDLKPEQYLREELFKDLSLFNTFDTMMVLGSATSDLSKTILLEIGRTMANLELGQKFANKLETRYAEAITSEQRTLESEKEEKTDDGIDLHAEREVSVPESRFAGARDAAFGQIRKNEKALSETKPQGNLQPAVVIRPVRRPSAGNRADGPEAVGADDGRDEQSLSGGRSVKGSQPDGMGGTDEQSQSNGGGNNSSGTDLRLEGTPYQEADSGELPAFFDEAATVLPQEKEASQQLSLFDAIESNAAEKHSNVVSLMPNMQLSQQIIDEALCIGANDRESRKIICAYFMKNKPLEESTQFLKKHYGTNGAGFYIGEQPYAMWYDAEGIRISVGMAARDRYAAMVTWEEAAGRIRELLELGEYLPQSELDHALEYERKRLASRLAMAVRDFSEEAKAAGYAPIVRRILSEQKGFPEIERYLAVQLTFPEELQKLIEEWAVFVEAYEKNEDLLRFQHNQPKALLQELRDLQKEPLRFPAAKEYKTQRRFFITDDEIDKVLQGRQDYRLAVYSFYAMHSDQKEREKYLKSYHGEYSGYHSSNDNCTYNGKGLTFSHGSISEPYAMAELSWNKITKRIGQLIAQDKFLRKEDRAAMADYELRALAESIYRFFVDAPKEFLKPFQEDTMIAYEESIQEIVGQLKMFERTEEIYLTMMLPLWDNTSQENRHYQSRKAGMEAMEAYRNGTYSIFGRQETLWRLADVKKASVSESGLEQSRMTTISAQQEGTDSYPALAEKILSLYKEYEELAGDQMEESDAELLEIRKERLHDSLQRGELSEELRVFSTHLAPEESLADELAQVAEVLHAMSEEGPIPRHNFRITDMSLGHGGAKEKYRANVAAIRLLKQIESENRWATEAEQEILSRYVGWGSLPMAFEEANAAWREEYRELKALFTEEEYAAARATTLNAHYTNPVIIKAIYQTIENLGFQTGNLLEPACGIGNFFGLLPDAMADARLYGVELEPISGKIARQLYQTVNISICGFEETAYPDNFFDVAVGNVPFGQYQVADKRYDKLKFSIHDYFFAKTLDLVRPGGIIALITSRYTMDKQKTDVRRYLAQRAELLGAIRLPNTAFKANAGTEVVADILFLQKRDHVVEMEPDWVQLAETEEGFPINRYFVEHPEMVLGKLVMESTQYGREACACVPFSEVSLAELLEKAVQNIKGTFLEADSYDFNRELEEEWIPAEPEVRNFSYTIVDAQVYYRENSRMYPAAISVTAAERVKGMIAIRDSVRALIDMQLGSATDEQIKEQQRALNKLYDTFTNRYGLLNSRANMAAFREDSAYPLLCSLEHLDENGRLKRKADLFFKRTIQPNNPITQVETASEALAVSLAEKACVDLPYMVSLMKQTSIEEVIQNLEGVIFKNPLSGQESTVGWEPSDEYLSGNVRQKLKIAELAAEQEPRYQTNVEALKKVQPEELSAAEIEVRLGTTWIPPEMIQQFMYELLHTSLLAQKNIKVLFLEQTAEWKITHKTWDRNNVQANSTYGTERANAYRILEDTLNLRDVRIFDYVEDSDGKKKAVLNKNETIIAQGKQEQMKQVFADWIWQDAGRRDQLVQLYNELFNSNRPREYDGSHIRFVGMNPEIKLRPHQKNAIARILYGGNTLLAHVVGAGKSATRS